MKKSVTTTMWCDRKFKDRWSNLVDQFVHDPTENLKKNDILAVLLPHWQSLLVYSIVQGPYYAHTYFCSQLIPDPVNNHATCPSLSCFVDPARQQFSIF